MRRGINAMPPYFACRLTLSLSPDASPVALARRPVGAG